MTTESLIPSTEAIAHQVDDKLFRALTDAFENIVSQKELAIAIPKIIQEHTQVDTNFHVIQDPTPNAFAATPDMNKNHPFHQEWMRQYFTGEQINKVFRKEKVKALTGSLNRETSTVAGLFTKITFDIGITTGLFNGKFPTLPNVKEFTAKEKAAAILHELGHIFSYLESLADTLSVNWALETAYAELVGTQDQTVHIRIFRDLEDALDIKLPISEQLMDQETLITLVLAEHSKVTRSKLGANMYDLRSWEAASDQFASRHGASVALGFLTDKMSMLFGDDGRETALMFWIGQFASTVGALLMGTLDVLSKLISFAFGDLIAMTISAFSNPFVDIYDPNKMRIDRIRQDVVSRLKKRRLPKEYLERTISDFEQLSKLLENLKVHETLWRKIYMFCSANTRRQIAKMTVQQELELLANNELFITAARLRVLV